MPWSTWCTRSRRWMCLGSSPGSVSSAHSSFRRRRVGPPPRQRVSPVKRETQTNGLCSYLRCSTRSSTRLFLNTTSMETPSWTCRLSKDICTNCTTPLRMVIGLDWKKSLRCRNKTKSCLEKITLNPEGRRHLLFVVVLFPPRNWPTCVLWRRTWGRGTFQPIWRRTECCKLFPVRKKQMCEIRVEWVTPGAWALDLRFRWFQQSHSLHETRPGVHRLHQRVLHWRKQISGKAALTLLHQPSWKCACVRSVRATDRRTTSSPLRALSHTRWKTSGGWCGNGNVTPSSCSPSSRRGSR